MRTILLAALLLSAVPAAAEWERYESTESGDVFYLDPDTIRIDGDRRRVWRLIDLKKRSTHGELSRRILWEYDCHQKRLRFLQLSTHSGQMGGGATLANSSTHGKWLYVPPGTVAETVFTRVCNHRP